jgi:MarR family transcriptional regulator for hemolysin
VKYREAPAFMSGPPRRPPIGLKLATTAKKVSRAFDDALVAVGGSRPLWLILISLKSRRLASQEELASAVGIRGATLTHHLDAMEAEGLVTRRRDPRNRRVHVVKLTTKGDAAFHRMRGAAGDFDRRLRVGLAESDTARLAELLDRLEANVADGAETKTSAADR